jgi:hypothetical protein
MLAISHACFLRFNSHSFPPSAPHRERQTEVITSRHARLYKESREEVISLREALTTQQGSQHSNMRLISEMKSELDALRAALREQKTHVESLHIEAQRRQELVTHDTKEQEERHASELAAIDSQVRQALARKEEQIQRLQHLNQALQQDQHEMQVGLQSVLEGSRL